MTLESIGWNSFFSSAFAPHAAAGLRPARVALEHKRAYELLSAHGDIVAECSGRLLYAARSRSDLPAVGDWVAVQAHRNETHAVIHAILPRRTKFSRRTAGDGNEEQIVAANVDTVFLVTALDQNFNLRRIERYLAAAWDSGAQPIVVLNKADLHPDPAAAREEVGLIAGGVPVVLSSATGDEELEALSPWLTPGTTVALLGSSGVGKSTLINRLLGEERQPTQALSAAVGKGRHTTTRRELLVLPSGALVIDTPGMRELQLWNVTAGSLDAAFDDIAALTARCRFSNCTHRSEPGCAVQAALEDGSLDFGRWQSFEKLRREQAYAARKADPELAREHQAKWKKIHRSLRTIVKQKRQED